MRLRIGCVLGLLLVARAEAQLLATDDFESYTNSPVGQVGGAGDWTGLWSFGSQLDGGAFLSTASKISGTQSIGLYGSGGSSGTSVSRPFPSCADPMTISASMRADFNVADTNVAPAGNCRMAFTIRHGNDPSHFTNQRLSFFFAAGASNFVWYDGVNRTSTLSFVTNHRYNLRVELNPVIRSYSFVVSNQNNGASHSYAGSWSLGTNGEPMGSVAFLMRGPPGTGNDAFLDQVLIDAPDYVAPPLQSLPIVEGDLWRYHKGSSTPPLQGTNQWYRPEFSDLSWAGPAPSGFGYGDCDDATVLGDMQNNYISLFTRKQFLVQDPGSISHLALAADYDDGLVAYLNGVEIARLNMPAGTITRHTAAATSREGSRGEGSSQPNEKSFLAVDPSLLVAGTNLLAVSGHNVSTNSSDFTLIVELYTNTALVRGPFIQMPDPGHSASIIWRTATPADSVVDYGLDLSYSSGTVSNGTPTREHAVGLSNLSPGTSYFYRVRGNGQILSEGHAFRTRPSADQRFRFAIIGDHGMGGSSAMYSIANLLNARSDFDAVVTAGDNIYGQLPCNLDGAPGWYDPFWFKLYEPTMRRVTTFPTLGNHDWDTAQGFWMTHYFHLPTNGPVNYLGKNYSAEFGNIHFISIDTEPYEDNTTNEMSQINAWIESDLAAATQRWRVAMIHRPPYTSQGNHNDQARVKEHVVPRLKAGGVQLVIQGHNHFFERINAIDGMHFVTMGACGAGLYPLNTIKEYSRTAYNARHSFLIAEVDGDRMRLEAINDLGQTIADYALDIGPVFNLDGLAGDPAWIRASNGLNLHAAIHRDQLYVATQDAGEGNDHFIYVASGVSTQRPANWTKSGTVMQWGAFLADENDSGYHAWFDENGVEQSNPDAYNSMTSGFNNNGTNGNGVLEGTLALSAHFGSFPTQLLIAAAPFGTSDGGALVHAAQVPAGNGNGNIEASEFLVISTRDLALDLPAPVAAPPAALEAGLPMSLDGAASYSPSGLPLTFAWNQVSGTQGVFTATNAALTTFTLAANVSGVQTVVVRLVVQDGRFAEELLLDLVFNEMIDSDGDGLSDGEEQTGVDNVLTPLNPNGYITNPALADSDGDGMTDGQEAIAGTDPNDPSSTFEIVTQQHDAGGGLVLQWASVAGKAYTLWSSTNLFALWTPVASNLTATPPMNVHTVLLNGVVDYFAVETSAP